MTTIKYLLSLVGGMFVLILLIYIAALSFILLDKLMDDWQAYLNSSSDAARCAEQYVPMREKIEREGK